MTEMNFPTIVNNEARLDDMASVLDWLAVESSTFKKQLAVSGAILFRGFPVRTAEDFDAFSGAFGYLDFTYRESLSNAVRINHTPRVFTANEAPRDIEIYLHHEMAQTPISPEKIFFCCLAAAEEGGATPVCRSDKLYAAFKERHPERAAEFADRGLKYRMHMPAEDDATSGQGRSWRSTLGVNSMPDAEAKLEALGYTWQWQDDGSLVTRTPVLAAVKTIPDGSESFYNQVIAAHLGWKRSGGGVDDALTFGDDTPIPAESLAALVAIAEEFTVPLEWQDGDVALVDNHRVMHGRYPYSGSRKREVVVCLAREAS
jgi:hypothetical protein